MKVPLEMNMGLPVAAPSPQLKVFNHGGAGNNQVAADDGECTVREQDRFMPIANVIRIMRKILPPHAKISDDAKETIQECVSEYISFITGEANERCQREQRKTITAEDVLWAMSKLGFDDYIEPLTLYLHRYREYDGGERGSLRGDPLLKRTMVDPASYPPFVPPFPVGHHHAYFGFPPPMNGGGYLQRDESNAGTSQPAPAANIDPYPHCKE
nr:nuclear transcription factor Y subunit B-6-like [Ipomoea batatas]